MRRVTTIAALWVFLAACNGVLDDSDPDPADGGDGADGGGDGAAGCESILCNTGEECVDGRCLLIEPCRDVRCDNPGEVCVDGACVTGAADADGDGFQAAEDCDDGDATVNPAAIELCNGRDDDCDDEVDEGYDRDGDGSTSCGGGVPELADCDDSDEAVHPTATETCNGRDDDCDGEIDDGVAGVGESCGRDTGDCTSGLRACVDGDMICEGEVGPRSEQCDGSDRDCDGDRGCDDSDCDATSCSAEGLCFGGVCAEPCDTHNDGSVSCSTLCGWCRGSCRGAVRDTGEVVSCGFDGEPMWCYCEF